MEELSEDELEEVLHNFQKKKIQGLNGWTIYFFVGIFEFIRKDILKVVEESRVNGHIHAPLNATFIALIPKVDDPKSLDDFRHISLCNNVYKIISRIISKRIKAIISKYVSHEQFGFLEGRQIHEAIRVVQEALHNIKTQKIKST